MSGPSGVERVERVIDPREIARIQRKPVGLQQPLSHELRVSSRSRGCGLAVAYFSNSSWTGAPVRPRRPLTREQSGHEIRPVGRHLEERFVEEVKAAVLRSHVDDERHHRPDGRDVAEVLFRSDPDIDPAARAERSHDVGEHRLVRDEIVGVREGPGRLGQLRCQPPELRVRQRPWQRRTSAGRRPEKSDNQHERNRSPTT